jgi:hypothetical protein
MVLVYNEIDVFIDRLKKEDLTIPVYMTIIPSKKEPEIITAMIRMQFCDKHGVFHTFNYTEGIHEVGLIPLMFLERITDPELQKEVRAEYGAEIDDYNLSVKEEYEKAKKMFEGLGYKNIVEAFTA